MANFLIFSAAFIALVACSSGAILHENVSLKCLPNRTFTYDHNDCRCNGDGTKIFCKRKMYNLLAPVLHQNQLQKIVKTCAPGETFEEQCQRCTCDESGEYATCLRTGKGCSDEKAGSRDNCTAGTVFADQCNTCICGSDGKGTCTNLDCPVLKARFLTMNVTTCVPDSFLIFECNYCNCYGTGKGLACDRMGCSNMNFEHENLLNVTIACTPHTTFDYNCHQCQCGETGSYAMCNGKSCPFVEDIVRVVDTVDKCNPGMIFADDCNVCICNADGKGTCTTLDCDLDYRFKYV